MTTLTLEYDKDARAYDMHAVINHTMLINIYDVSIFSLIQTGKRLYKRRV
jgi:hypothetical protein